MIKKVLGIVLVLLTCNVARAELSPEEKSSVQYLIEASMQARRVLLYTGQLMVDSTTAETRPLISILYVKCYQVERDLNRAIALLLYTNPNKGGYYDQLEAQPREVWVQEARDLFPRIEYTYYLADVQAIQPLTTLLPGSTSLAGVVSSIYLTNRFIGFMDLGLDYTEPRLPQHPNIPGNIARVGPHGDAEVVGFNTWWACKYVNDALDRIHRMYIAEESLPDYNAMKRAIQKGSDACNTYMRVMGILSNVFIPADYAAIEARGNDIVGSGPLGFDNARTEYLQTLLTLTTSKIMRLFANEITNILPFTGTRPVVLSEIRFALAKVVDSWEKLDIADWNIMFFNPQ